MRVPLTSVHVPGCLQIHIDASLLTKAKFKQSVPEIWLVESFSQTTEIVIAGISNRFNWIQRREVTRMRTDSLKSFVRILFMTECSRVASDYSGTHCSEG